MKAFITKHSVWLVVLLAFANQAVAQDHTQTIREYLNANAAKYKLGQEDLQFVVTDQTSNKKTGFTYVYLNQSYQGVPIFGAVSSMAIRDGQVKSFANRFMPGLALMVNATAPALTPEAAIGAAAAHLGVAPQGLARQMTDDANPNHYLFNKAGISSEDIKVELYYVAHEEGLLLSWNVIIREVGLENWWNIRVDATTGAYLEKNNWTTHCDFGPGHEHSDACQGHFDNADPIAQANPENVMAGSYRVYDLPVESPNHGVRTLVSNPDDATASPFGWHDTNGAAGAEFNTTRGNNVLAQEDFDGQDGNGALANGGVPLIFDFPIDLTQAPATYVNSALTNLFFINNKAHDITYHYGFDEAGGNFQSNNYGNGGAGNDYVIADGQDGGGTNNANFSTPPDGQNGYMQMYLWTGAAVGNYNMIVNSPVAVAGQYAAAEATLGPVIATPITGNLVLVNDATAPVTDGCDAYQNGNAVNGNIALVDRGTCTFATKIFAAQNNGAIACVVCNNVAGAPIAMGGTDPGITIPSIMIQQADCNAIKAQLAAGNAVNITLPVSPNQNAVDRDGDLDNAIIIHEFTHGISNRLTGGPANTNCLGNNEQMGEGWSDYIALMLTMEPGDAGADIRGMGTFAIGQPTYGTGIRTYPYSTDMAIDPHTYSDIPNESIPHGVGSVWCVMLWDMTWALIDQYGFDPDLYNGTGGNNIALQLVMEGMKLQPCGPGFVDGRDAILQADINLYGGANQCLIWNAFARRGLGFSADQGSPNTVGDETEAFDVPPACIVPTQAPVAAFTVDALVNCTGVFNFTDQSTNTPQSWDWNFGDGTTSTLQNPSHTYTAAGTYTVTLLATNIIGSDTYTLTVEYSAPSAPTVTGNLNICAGQNTTLTASTLAGYNPRWYNAAGTTPLAQGATFTTPALNVTTGYNVRFEEIPVAQNVGSLNYQANGGNFNNGTARTLLFTATVPFTLVSAQVNAQGAGNRTFNLYDAGGAVIQTVTVNVPAGVSRVNLGFNIPAAGNYSVGGANMNLWRNNANVAFPYAIPNVVSIYSTNAGANPTTLYYFLYDWIINVAGCNSPMTPVTVNVLSSPVAAFNVAVNGANATFTDQSTGATSWQWDFGDGQTSNLQNPTHTYSVSGSYTVTEIVSNGTCNDTLTRVVDAIFAVVPPLAQFTVDVQTSCDGLFSFTDQSQNLPTSWSWDFGDGTTDTLQNPTHQYNTPGTYTVILTATNDFGSDTASLVVNYSAPSAPAVTGVLDICPGLSTTLSAAPNLGYTTTWYDAAGTTVLGTGDNFTTPLLNATTSYQVQYVENTPVQNVGSTNLQANGGFFNNAIARTLLFTATVPFTLVSAQVNAQGAGNRTFNLYDAGGAVIQTVTVNVPAGISRINLGFNIPAAGNYSVGGSNVNLWRNNANVTYPYTLPGVVSIYNSNAGLNIYYFLYDWEVTQPGCNSPLAPVTVNVLPAPTAAFTSSVNINTATFTDQSTGATTWQWDFGDGQTSNIQNPTHTYSVSGSYTVTEIVTNGTCADTIVQVVDVIFAILPPIAQFSVDALTNCSGLFTFTDQSLDVPTDWLWDFGDGNTSTDPSPVHQYAAPGIYTVLLTVTNQYGSDTASVVVNYDAPVAPVPMGNLTVCQGQSTMLYVAGNPGYTAVWYDSLGNQVMMNDTFNTPALIGNTTYSVRYEENTPLQYVGSLDIQANGGNHINNAARTLLFTASVPFTLVSAEVNATGAGNRTFNLYDAGGAIIQTVVVNVPNGISRIPLYFDIPAAGNYSIGGANMNLWRNNAGVTFPYDLPGVVSIYSSNAGANNYYYLYDWAVALPGCNSPLADVTVNVVPGPTAAFTWSNVDPVYTFTDQSTGATTWDWNFGDGNTSTTQNPTHTYAAPGQYTVTLIVTNGSCPDTITQVIDAVFATQPPVADFTVDALVNCSGNFAFTDLTQNLPSNWLWDFGDGTTDSTQNPSHQYATPGVYTVLLTASNYLGSDTMSLVVDFNLPSAPVVSGNLNLCEGDSTVLTTTSAAGYTAHWTDANGVEVAMGDTLATPALFATTTYQVTQIQDALAGFVGSLDDQANGGALNSGILRTLLFTAYSPFTLVSAEVNATGAGDRTFTLYDATGTVAIQSVTVTVPAGVSRVNLGLSIPAAGDYQIGGINMNLWRNNANVTYPYSLPGVVDITGSNVTPNGQNFYYYLYNWEVVQPACESATTTVTVNVSPPPTADFTCTAVNEVVTFTDLSTNATTWLWDFGDGTTDNTQNPVHTYAAPGNYTVLLTVTNGSCTDTITRPCDVIIIGTGQPVARDFRLFPNPANGQVTIQLNGYAHGNETVEVFTTDGRLAIQAAWPALGSNMITLDCSNLAEGAYMARVHTTEGVIVKRFTIQR